jgi:hypothetical protein
MILSVRFANDELILRRPRRALARGHDHRAGLGDPAFATEDDLFVQRLGRQIPIRLAQIGQAVVFQPVIGLKRASLILARRLDVQ